MVPVLLQADQQKHLEVHLSSKSILTSLYGYSFPSVPAPISRPGSNEKPAFTSEPDPFFDDLLALAASVCGAPVALLVSPEQTRCWLREDSESTHAELARELSFCSRAAALSDGLMVMPDAAVDRILRDDPFVRSEPWICFHASAPLITLDGQYLGGLHVIDYSPRNLRAEQRSALARLSRQAVAHLVLRRQSRELAQAVRDQERCQTQAETCRACRDR